MLSTRRALSRATYNIGGSRIRGALLLNLMKEHETLRGLGNELAAEQKKLSELNSVQSNIGRIAQGHRDARESRGHPKPESNHKEPASGHNIHYRSPETIIPRLREWLHSLNFMQKLDIKMAKVAIADKNGRIAGLERAIEAQKKKLSDEANLLFMACGMNLKRGKEAIAFGLERLREELVNFSAFSSDLGFARKFLKIGFVTFPLTAYYAKGEYANSKTEAIIVALLGTLPLIIGALYKRLVASQKKAFEITDAIAARLCEIKRQLGPTSEPSRASDPAGLES